MTRIATATTTTTAAAACSVNVSQPNRTIGEVDDSFVRVLFIRYFHRVTKRIVEKDHMSRLRAFTADLFQHSS